MYIHVFLHVYMYIHVFLCTCSRKFFGERIVVCVVVYNRAVPVSARTFFGERSPQLSGPSFPEYVQCALDTVSSRPQPARQPRWCAGRSA